MPGIVGLVTNMPREWAEPQLLRMVSALRHESFYETGTWIDESLGVYVGWIARRNSFSDGMPLRNEKEDVVLVFSGEDFPEPVTACSLRQRGHELEVGGPSYLVHVYEEDASFPASLNGRFQGLLTDRNRRTAILFNDRYGLHRIYYHESKDAFYYAAEAKAILAVRPSLRRPDPQGLGELVACGCVLENRTIFEGIRVLPPASVWSFRNSSLESKGSYFQPREWEDQESLDSKSYYQQLREVFSQNLPRYFNGRERIGMSLTGGLDSRMIMAWKKSTPGSLACYSFGEMSRDCQDVHLARKVARACGQPHEVIPVGEGFLSRFPHYAERSLYLTDGCTGVECSADLYINERARQIAPVRMTGNYGGEVLRRVTAFKPVEPLPGLFRPEFLTYVRQAGGTYEQILRGHPLSFAVFMQAPWHHYGMLALEETQLSLRTPYLDNRFVQTVFRAPESTCVNNDLCLRLIADGDAALLRIRTDRGLAGDQGRLATAISRELLEFTFKAEYAYDDGMPQWVAGVDHLFSAFRMERLFLGRHKFTHYRVWYRDSLSAYVREILLDPQTLSRPYIQRSVVESVVQGHSKGNRNYTTAIHQLLTMELLHRLFFDRSEPVGKDQESDLRVAQTYQHQAQ
jgi:asparagine synthase (glutamine-hydrolysing)